MPDLYLVSFFYVSSGTGMTSLLGHSEMQCNGMYFDVILETCGDYYD